MLRLLYTVKALKHTAPPATHRGPDGNPAHTVRIEEGTTMLSMDVPQGNPLSTDNHSMRRHGTIEKGR